MAGNHGSCGRGRARGTASAAPPTRRSTSGRASNLPGAGGGSSNGWPGRSTMAGDPLDEEMEAALGRMAEEGLPENAPPGDLSHDALAIGQEWADSARYVDQWGAWFHWDGGRWAHDLKRLTWTLAR